MGRVAVLSEMFMFAPVSCLRFRYLFFFFVIVIGVVLSLLLSLSLFLLFYCIALMVPVISMVVVRRSIVVYIMINTSVL